LNAEFYLYFQGDEITLREEAEHRIEALEHENEVLRHTVEYYKTQQQEVCKAYDKN